ncbi:MAG: hypothetical protein QXJ72_08530 [Thermoproteota archaeon]
MLTFITTTTTLLLSSWIYEETRICGLLELACILLDSGGDELGVLFYSVEASFTTSNVARFV